MGRTRTGGRERGFTLIELLVVLAVIALLMGIVMPALQRVRSQDKAAACKANLRSLGMIWRTYKDEHDGKFAAGDQAGWARGDWVLPLRKYWADKDQILLCPSATKRRVVGNSTVPWGSYDRAYVQLGYQGQPVECSYGYNLWLFTLPQGVIALQGRPRELHYDASYTGQMTNVPLFLDSMWRGGGPWYGDVSGNSSNPIYAGIRPSDFNGQWISFNNEMMHFAIDRHSGGVNGVFLDGTVRPMGIKELWTLKWHRQFDTRGPWTKAGGVQPEDWPAWMRGFKDY